MEEPVNREDIKRSLEINPSQKFLMGVCAAFGDYVGVHPIIIRLIVLLAFIFIGQPIILIYAAFGILLPFSDKNELIPNFRLNKLTLNFLALALIVLLILIQLNQLTLKEIFTFISERIDSFTFLVFSIALIINSYHKEVFEMDSTNYKKLTLSDKKVILGVCGGLAEYLNIPPNLMRFIWIIFGIASLGTAIIVYIVLRFIIPVKKNVERDEII
jgi:phage shock protein C